MKKTIACTVLLGIFCTATYAETAPQPTATGTTTPTVSETKTTVTTETTTPASADSVPTTNTDASIPTSSDTTTSSVSTATTPVTSTEPEAIINCDYKIAPNKEINDPLLTTWAEKAAIQSFDFSPDMIDNQLEKLKTCFTDQGWKGFYEALEKSGNINVIKTQKLTVSSQVEGNITINPIKENQWKVSVPMQVVYQNEQEKLTQLLSIDLLIGRKVSGDLGIVQVVAKPRPSDAALVPATPSATTPVVSDAVTPAPSTTTTQ